MKPVGVSHNYANMPKSSVYCGVSIAVTDVCFRCQAESMEYLFRC
jgi:hypothetical protein